ncbi:response regulator transcription factor [Niveispirillum sp.]|uniref:LuxR C-terminal-related transcriptional regulator n=1 Tax=Niveispirillum sp. TaxID=1917217 RepID=UPI001B68DB66|nr:response regulator transcription factor [Niveispirillum sp.]MBP7336626.1 response regulator transcription factor [Niveispirillum sp.]
MSTQTVILIDANKLFREGLSRLLLDVPFRVAAEYASVEEAMTNPSVEADLVLVDPGEEAGALSKIAALRQQRPTAPLVILTGGLDARRLTQALEAGVAGYLMKDMSADALAQSLRLVMMGEKVFPTHLAELLVSGQVQPHAATEITALRKGLSQRETQILRCLIDGDSNKIIASGLGITEATVKVHLKSLLRKINAVNRTQAAIWAMNNGIGQADGAQAANSDGPETAGVASA